MAIGAYSVANNENEFSVGRDKTDNQNQAVYRRVTHVADGVKDNDAVNLSQLKAVQNGINNSYNLFQNLDIKFGKSISSTAALPLIGASDKTNFAVGYGDYKGFNSFALGAYYRPNENIVIYLGGTLGGEEHIINAGISFKLGKGTIKKETSTEIKKEIKELKEKNNILEKSNKKLEQAVEEQQKRIQQLELSLQ